MTRKELDDVLNEVIKIQVRLDNIHRRHAGEEWADGIHGASASLELSIEDIMEIRRAPMRRVA